MQKEPREVWARRVERWRKSGLSAKVFAAQESVSWHALKNWKHRLACGDRGGERSSTALVKRADTGLSNLAEAHSSLPLAGLSFVELSMPADQRFVLEVHR